MREVFKNYLAKGQNWVSQQEACKCIGITTPTLYKLRAMGKAPKEIRIPDTRIVRYSIEELDAWMTARENPGKAERIGIAEQKAKLKLASDIALASIPTGTEWRSGRRPKVAEAAE